MNIAKTRKEIIGLANWQNQQPQIPVITIYLPLRRQENLHTLINSLISSYRESEWYEENTKGGRQDSVEKALKLIREHVEGMKRKMKGKTWVFCLQNQELIGEIFLPEEHKAFLMIGKRPFVGFLAQYLQPESRYLVLLLERERAQIYEHTFGNLKLLHQLTEHVPKKVRRGSHNWMGFRSDPNEFRIQRHIRWHLNEFIKKVTDLIFDEFERGLKQEKYDRIIIGTHSELRHPLYKNLHPYLKEKIAAEFNVDIDESEISVLKKLWQATQKFEAEAELATLQQVANNEPVAIGYEAVGRSLEMGAVDSLIINERFGANNLFLFDETVRQGIKTGSKIKMLRHHQDKAPDLSAILRFQPF